MAITDVMLAIGRSLELSVLVKTTILLALGLAGAHLARSARASVRHSLLAATFGVVLVLPVATMLMPPIAIARTVQTVPLGPVVALKDDNPVIEATASVSTVVPVTSLSISPIDVLRAGWALGILVGLISLVTGLWRIRHIRRHGLPWPNGEAIARRLAANAGISRSVRVLLNEDVVAPTTCGWVRPVVIMPIDAPTWAATDIDNALVHELEHVYRRDWPIHILARVVCAVYWFHPLAWAAWRQLSLEAERACDDAVLVRSDRTAYAEQLLVLARRLLHGRSHETALSMANRSDLSSRIAAVLDVNLARGRTGALNGAAFGVAGLLLVLLISPLAALQQSAVPPGGDAPVAATLAFEVASIKPNKSTEPGFVGFQPGGRFTATGVTVKQLISLGYARDNTLRDFQIVGGPRWSETDHFDVQAKAEATPDGRERSPQELFSMIHTLLAQRFGLRAHRETRPLPIYALVADSAGKLGPRLRRAEWDCYAPPGATPPARPPGKTDLPCRGGRSAGRLTGRGMPIAVMLGGLSSVVGRMVEDRTGLTGAFDWDLEWTPMPGEPAPPPRPGDAAEIPTDKPWILTAIQEQLGLKLESTRGPVEVVVIDTVQRPSDDAAQVDSPAPAALAVQSRPTGTTIDANRRASGQQATAREGPAFEVASIKTNRSGETGAMYGIQRPGGRFTARNAVLKELIRLAYQLQAFQLAGAPDWIDSARFDIEGKLEFDPQRDPDGVDPQWLMVRTLLADRFNLRVHREQKELPIYSLILARADGRLGPQMRPTEGGCTAIVAERERGGPPPPPGAPFRCGLGRRPGGISGRERAMAQFVNVLGPLVGRIVVDRTGLMDNFDFDLSWTPDPIAPSPADSLDPTRTDLSGPSIFTALQEQLGLKLESTRGPVEVLVIDGVEQPTSD